MEKMNLSLKNIYRLLMTNDFPIYSESVIDEKNRKGQTLLKFWYSLLINEFQDLPYGRISMLHTRCLKHRIMWTLMTSAVIAKEN